MEQDAKLKALVAPMHALKFKHLDSGMNLISRLRDYGFARRLRKGTILVVLCTVNECVIYLRTRKEQSKVLRVTTYEQVLPQVKRVLTQFKAVY
jgi:hypothetical protein